MKTKLLFLTIIALFITGSVFAQWVKTTSTVPSAQVRSISVNGSNILVGSMTGWAFGPSGGVYYSTNGGTTFTKTTVTPNTRVWAVMLAGSNFLVGSDGGGIHLSTNNGTTWTNPLASKYVRAFASDGAGNLYAAGNPNGVWRSTDNGSSWSLFATPGTNLLSITVIGSTFLVGNNSDGIYRSGDGGVTWTHPLIATTNVWSFATIGSTIFANSTTGLYRSTDDGLTWTLISNPGSSWQACPMVAVGETLFVGTSTGVKMSTDMGVTWMDVNTGLTVEVAGLAADSQYAYAGSGGYTLSGSFYFRPLSEMISSLCANPTSAGEIGSDQESCGSFDPALITSISPASGATGPIEYKWQSSVTPFTAWVDIPSSNAATYNPGVITQTTHYKRLVRSTCKTSWTDAPESNTVTMTVNSVPQLQMTMNNIQVTDNNNGTVDAGSFDVCVSENNLNVSQMADLKNVTGNVKVATQIVETTNVASTFADATVLLSNYAIPGSQSVELIDPGQQGTLVVRFQLFNDLDDNNALDAGECAGDAIAYTITVNPTLTAMVSITASENNVCEGTEVTFTATPTNEGDAPSYEWLVKGQAVGTGIQFTYAPADGDIVTVVMTSNASPCLAGSPVTSNEVVMTVNPLVTPSVTIAASSNPSCAGAEVVFTATPTNGGTDPVYVWKVNGVEAGINADTYSYSPANDDLVTCEMTPDATITCPEITTAVSNTITMVVYPTEAKVSIVSDLTTVCAGTEVTFTATPVNEGNAPVYQWKVGGINAGTNSTTFTYAPVNKDIVTCEMTSDAPCVTAVAVSNAIEIAVNPILTASVSISPSQNNVCEGTEVTFTPVPVEGGNAPTYQWYVNSDPVGSGNTYSYIPNDGDDVTVTMTSNSPDCLASLTVTSDPITMIVNPRPELKVTINTVPVTANNDGVDDTQALNVCNSKTKNLFYEYAEMKGVSPTSVKVIAKYVLSNVIVALQDGVFALSAPITGSTNVRLNNTALPGSLVMSYRAFVDVNNNNVLDAGECPGDWIVFTVTIPPALKSAGAISGPATVQRGSTQTYSVSPVTNATHYVWTYSGTGATITSANTAGNEVRVAFAANATVGTLSVRPANDCGEGPISSLKLKLTKSGLIGLDPETASQEVIPLKVYPIRNVEIRMEGTVGFGAMATLYDILGRVVMTRELEEGNLNVLPLDGLKPSVYMLSINDNGKIQTFKVPVK